MALDDSVTSIKHWQCKSPDYLTYIWFSIPTQKISTMQWKSMRPFTHSPRHGKKTSLCRVSTFISKEPATVVTHHHLRFASRPKQNQPKNKSSKIPADSPNAGDWPTKRDIRPELLRIRWWTPILSESASRCPRQWHLEQHVPHGPGLRRGPKGSPPGKKILQQHKVTKFSSFCIFSWDIWDIARYLQVKNMSKTWQTSWWIGQVMFIPSKNMVKICCNKFQQPYLVPDESWWVIILFLAEITDVEPAQLNVNPSAVR